MTLPNTINRHWRALSILIASRFGGKAEYAKYRDTSEGNRSSESINTNQDCRRKLPANENVWKGAVTGIERIILLTLVGVVVIPKKAKDSMLVTKRD